MANVSPLPAELAVPVEPFTDDELDAALDAVLRGKPDEVPAKIGSFELTDDSRAEWAMRKLSDLVNREAEFKDQAAEWRDRINQWEAERVRLLQMRAQVFIQALEAYGVNKRARDENDKTTTLPSGVIKTTRPKAASVHIGNEAAVIEWAQKNLPAAIRDLVVKTNPKAYVSELRKIVKVVRGKTGVRVEYEGQFVPGVFTQEPETTAAATPNLYR